MNSALKQRVITGIILALVVVLAVLYTPPPVFATFSLIALVSIGGWEWSRLVDFVDSRRGLFVAALLAFSLLAYFIDDLRWTAIVIGVITWAAILVLLATYEQGTVLYKQNTHILRISAFLVIIPAWVALITLHQHSPAFVIYLIFLVACADSGAYFSGKKFGKNKLAPELSPGKTREGMFGGFIAAIIWAILGANYFNIASSDWLFFIILSATAALISVSGDLFESLIKREAGQKDSGNILPGHGGILDRVDGLLAALPIFTLGLFWGSILG